MKRFWDHAAAVPDGEGWRITLDGRPVRIPGGAELHLPSQPLADAVAVEWQRAGEATGGETSFSDLPFTRLAGTAQARIAPDPEPTVLELARYGDSDLLCYRAAAPPALMALQEAQWQPWLDRAARVHGARLRAVAGVMPVPQSPEALAALAIAVAVHGPLMLAGLGVAVPALGSLVLGLALAEGALDAVAAHALATLDETFQEAAWGRDAEALARRHRTLEEVVMAGRFLDLVRRP